MRGRALLFATSRYDDPRLASLSSTRIDLAGLKRVFSDSKIGDLDVIACLDTNCQAWRESIEEFFSDASPDMFLLLYVSGHAIKDRDGKLYFAASDTRVNRLLATGVSANLIQEASANSPSHQIAMVFDTCFSGAFAKGTQIKAISRDVNASEYFREGTGKVVITASDAMQYALAGDSIEGSATPSLFTGHVIEGLRTGAADVDGDGNITSEDLFKYVSKALHNEHADQRPQRWTFAMTGDLMIASNPVPRPGTLPDHVLDLLGHPRVDVRILAIENLLTFLRGSNIPLRLAARRSLEQLLDDDSRKIAKAAKSALDLVSPPPTVSEVFSPGTIVSNQPSVPTDLQPKNLPSDDSDKSLDRKDPPALSAADILPNSDTVKVEPLGPIDSPAHGFLYFLLHHPVTQIGGAIIFSIIIAFSAGSCTGRQEAAAPRYEAPPTADMAAAASAAADAAAAAAEAAADSKK